jgi:hypothetical protein
MVGANGWQINGAGQNHTYIYGMLGRTLQIIHKWVSVRCVVLGCEQEERGRGKSLGGHDHHMLVDL